MTKELNDVFEKYETQMGISGILSELAEFTSKCSTDALNCGDKQSSGSYARDSKKIQLLANKIRGNDR